MARDVGQIVAFRQSSEACPIPAAIELIGERWTFLILRGTLLGLRHFEQFQACLGIARNILSDRLARLVAADVLMRSVDPCDRRKVIYALTEKGAGLLPMLVALRQWGLDAGLGTAKHATLVDRTTRLPIARLRVQAQDGRDVELGDLMWLDEDGQELSLPVPDRTTRTAA